MGGTSSFHPKDVSSNRGHAAMDFSILKRYERINTWRAKNDNENIVRTPLPIPVLYKYDGRSYVHSFH